MNYADFSDMFDGREEEAVPESLRPMLEAVCRKPLATLKLAYNSLGLEALSIV